MTQIFGVVVEHGSPCSIEVKFIVKVIGHRRKTFRFRLTVKLGN